MCYMRGQPFGEDHGGQCFFCFEARANGREVRAEADGGCAQRHLPGTILITGV